MVKTSKIFIALIALLFVFIGWTSPADAVTGWLSGWNYRQAITIDHTKVGNGVENETNFPVEISLSGLSNINANGTDIRFTDSSGTTTLAREIEYYSSGNLVAWVKVPTLSYSADTVIYMYYGSSTASEPANSSDPSYHTNVWDSNYNGVYHLPNGSTLSVNDSTSNVVNGTLSSPAPTATNGKINGGANFASSSAHSIGMGNNFNIGATDFTLSTWIQPTNVSQRALIMTKRKPTSNFNQYQLAVGYVNSSGSGVAGKMIGIFLYNGVGLTPGNALSYYTTNDVVDGNWHHIVATRASGKLSIYVDGTSVPLTSVIATSTSVVNPASTGNFYFGRYDTAAGGYYNGSIDETRISTNFARSAGWIKTEYNNQSATSTFYATSSQVALSGGNFVWTNGTGDGNWNTGGNWQGGVVPGVSDTAIFNSATVADCSINDNISVGGINIQSGYTGTITQSGAYTITIGSAGFVQADGIFSGGSGDITDGGVFTLTAGTFTSTIGTLSVAGNWSNSGTFNSRTGLVVLTGTNQSITGNNTFYKLTKSVASAATLTLAAGSSQVITNKLTLTGTLNNLLSLRSSSPGSQWSINPQGKRVLSYLDVQDSNNLNSLVIDASGLNCTNSDRNTNWLFTAVSNSRGFLLNGLINFVGSLRFR